MVSYHALQIPSGIWVYSPRATPSVNKSHIPLWPQNNLYIIIMHIKFHLVSSRILHITFILHTFDLSTWYDFSNWCIILTHTGLCMHCRILSFDDSLMVSVAKFSLHALFSDALESLQKDVNRKEKLSLFCLRKSQRRSYALFSLLMLMSLVWTRL